VVTYLRGYSSTSNEELITACTNSGDANAWEEFVHRFHPLIATITLRTARSWGETTAQLVDDLIQETYLKLCANNCKLLRNFRPPHAAAIFGFLKVVTVNVVHDHFKASHALKRGAGEPVESLDSGERDTAPQAGKNRSENASIEHEVLLRQIDSCLTRLLQPEELGRSRRIFWLYYRCGLSASAIASLPRIGLTTKGVESTLLRLSRLLKSELAQSATGSTSGKDSSTAPKGLGPSESFYTGGD
jgi:RNA polymerase sigma-70 factor (ECF subfamily)